MFGDDTIHSLQVEVEDLKAENKKLLAKLELAKGGFRHLQKHAMWGVEQNCVSILEELEKL